MASDERMKRPRTAAAAGGGVLDTVLEFAMEVGEETAAEFEAIVAVFADAAARVFEELAAVLLVRCSGRPSDPQTNRPRREKRLRPETRRSNIIHSPGTVHSKHAGKDVTSEGLAHICTSARAGYE